ncbi:calcium/sodium antiporter [Coleofasciculus sp. E1-EBD-02]|jgi:cation:H+ antiporter|uniref:calcium/sodium antiporter n=1 Tax=Coleofasciculus sp. E1-EBD-02 TaxID=3068481 RepID=UPI0032F793FF
MDAITILVLISGFVLLIAGAEILVRGASQLAVAAGLSPLVVGLTVVAYGTSAPELAVSVQSSYAGQADIAIGNVVGSNIANILLILGSSAAVAPLIVSRQLVRLDAPVMTGVSLLVWLMGWDGKLSRGDGIFLVMGAIAYTLFTLYQGRRESQAQEGASESNNQRSRRGIYQILLNLGLIIVGIGMLVVGSNYLIKGSVDVAQAFGISELIIGLTIVAAGTSLPEIATSVAAGIRGERDIAVGNAVGSNIFNLLLVLGVCSVVAPDGIAVSMPALNFDIPVMIAVAVACLPIFFTGYCIARWEGILFLAYYVAYTMYLFLNATEHDALEEFSAVMLLFVMPLTLITLLILAIRSFRKT